jgi:hypothetical protein
MSVTTLKYSPTANDFKDDVGRWRTKSLFMETNDNETKYPSIFTLHDEDRNGRISMRTIYLSCGDPTEHTAALAILGSFDGWHRLCKAPFFQPYLKSWRAELESQIRSQAVKTIGSIASGAKGTASQLSAAKWLAASEWEVQTRGTVKMGRPPKTRDPIAALREGLIDAEEDNEDYERIIETRPS